MRRIKSDKALPSINVARRIIDVSSKLDILYYIIINNLTQKYFKIIN